MMLVMCRSKGGDRMAKITASIIIDKTVSTLDAATIAAVIQWIDTNITQKLPADTTKSILLTIVP